MTSVALPCPGSCGWVRFPLGCWASDSMRYGRRRRRCRVRRQQGRAGDHAIMGFDLSPRVPQWIIFAFMVHCTNTILDAVLLQCLMVRPAPVTVGVRRLCLSFLGLSYLTGSLVAQLMHRTGQLRGGTAEDAPRAAQQHARDMMHGNVPGGVPANVSLNV